MFTNSPEKQISLKLMVIKERNKVVFAEAGKDFVDVLFSLFTLPLGTIVRLVREESNMQPIEVGSLTSLYQSVENLDEEFFSSDSWKQMILRPMNSMEGYCKSLKLKIDDTEPPEYFVCNNLVNSRCSSSVLITMFKYRKCTCGNMMNKPFSPGSSSYLFDGFVKNHATFMITDDLKVMPNSLNTFFDLFKTCGIESMSSVSEMTVTITKNQVIDLLKSCLISRITLTSLFLEKPYIEKYRKLVEFPPFDVNENRCMKIKVTIMQRKSNGRIVFAQGTEDFGDFLLNFLRVPLGGVAHLMESFSCMYNSIVNLDQNYWSTGNVRNKLVEPGFLPEFFLTTLSRTDLYVAVANQYNIIRQVKGELDTSTYISFVDLMMEGCLQGPVRYMATDDLVVTPMSTTSVISLLATMRVPFSDLEEKEVSIGIKEGVGILKASLTSKSALTNGLRHLLTEIKQEN